MNRPGRARLRKRRPIVKRSFPKPLSDRLIVRGLTLLVMIAYLPILHAGFIWGDNHYVTHNSALRTLAGLASLWTDPTATPQYCPLVYTTFWVEYHVWHLHAVG